MLQTNKKKGFTMIELVIVIVILGILAAMVLPRFANLQTRARQAAQNGLASSLIAAYQVAHAQWLTDGGTGSTVTIEGTSVAIGASGYPLATNSGIIASLTTITGFTHSSADNVTTFIANSGGTACGATYSYDGTGAPTVAAATGCI